MLHRFDVWFFAVLLVAWGIAYAVWFRPWLARYRLTAGIVAALQAREARGWAWVRLRLRGAETALLLALTSLATGGWGLIEAAFGIDPSALAPFQESALWRAVLRDETALRAAALTTFAAAVLTLRARLRDVRTVPHDGTAAPGGPV